MFVKKIMYNREFYALNNREIERETAEKIREFVKDDSCESYEIFDIICEILFKYDNLVYDKEFYDFIKIKLYNNAVILVNSNKEKFYIEF